MSDPPGPLFVPFYPPPLRERCERCGAVGVPRELQVVTRRGWWTFAVLLVVFFPLAWLGLRMREARRTCSSCGARL